MTKTNRQVVKGLLVAAAAAVALLGVWYNAELRPVDKQAGYQYFNVPQGVSAPYVGRQLEEAKLIRSKDAFLTYLGLHGLRSSVKAGEFSLSGSQSAVEIAAVLTGGGKSAKQLIVPPGATIKQIEAAAAEHDISTADFEAALAAPHPQAVLANKPAGVSLEGYLYPDTYDLGPGMTASRLVDTMITNLQNHLTPDIIQKWQSKGLNIHQGLTLASIVEKEVGPGPDRAKVAQVFLNRLKINMPLGSDVTAFYASRLAGQADNVSIQSPYNTRVTAGLPPGPICSPDVDAMTALANPLPNDFLYFLADKDGKIYYAKTYAEHQRNIQLHL
jgi:UPF0755 protein